MLEVALAIVGLGVAFSDTPMVPLLSMIVDERFTDSGYGPVYALYDMAMCVASIVARLLSRP